MPHGFDCDVLIVGGGPTGVTLGILLAQAGVDTLIVDKEAEIYPLPRAAHIDHEVMRIFQQAGIADRIAATSRTTPRYDFLTAKGEILLRFEGTDRIGPGGWPAGNMIHQPSLEAALRERFEALAPGRLLTGTAFAGFDEDADGVTATLADGQGERCVRARFLVGADGARSPVREAAGIGFEDLGFDEPWLVIDAIVKDASRLPEANLQVCDPARPTTCVVMGEGRHRWEFMLKPGETPQDMLDDVVIARLLEPWNVADAVTLERKAVYRFHARVARQWRKGRVLLAGDAAHQMPPFAGQGLCSGTRDAANLAWKLAAVIAGADAGLLDHYQPEREPNVRAIIDMAIMMGRTVCIADPAAAAERDHQMLAARAAGQAPDGALAYPPVTAGAIMPGTAGAGEYFPQFATGADIRFDDRLGEGAWLIATRPVPLAGPGLEIALLDDGRLGPAAGAVRKWLAAHAAEAVLVRPDRHVFGTGEPVALIRAWKRLVDPVLVPSKAS